MDDGCWLELRFWVGLGFYFSHGEADDASADLYCFREVWLELNLVILCVDEGSELRQVVFKLKLASDAVVFHEGVAPWDRDVAYADLALMASAHLENLEVLAGVELGLEIRFDNLNHSIRILLKSQGLKH